MNVFWEPRLGPDRRPFPRVFLSASVPSLKRDERFLKGDIEPRLMARVIETRVRDALASFVVQLLRAGGQLIFGGHPSIVPMVAAAAESFSNRRSDAFPILIYQSRRFFDSSPPIGRQEMESRGIGKTVWVPVDRLQAAELFNIDSQYLLDARRYDALCKEEQHDRNAPLDIAPALVVLRVVMVLDLQPQAILSMGGMEGIGAEASLFRRLRPEKPGYVGAFALKSTYGATTNLDAGHTHFIDERLTSSEMDSGAPLTPQENVEAASRQLRKRIRYDRIMEEFTHQLGAAM
jgi:hypothetical protein